MSGRGLRRVALAWAVVAIGWSAAGAQESPLVGDRPDFTESAQTVPRGRVQLEVGATRSEGIAGVDVEAGEALVRIGLAERWELRVGPGSWLDPPRGDSGPGDATLGFKVGLADGAGARPELALLAGVSLPTGASALSAGESVPEVTLAAGWEISERIGLGVNLGWAHEVDDGVRDHRLAWSLAAGFAHGERWGSFVEVFGSSREVRGGDPTATFDTGVTRLLHDDLQLDARIGWVLEDGGAGAADWFVGLGAVVRW